MKIVIAEDEQRAREGLREMIRSLGENYQIVGLASNGRIALEMIQEQHPDVVFTDIKMPYLSGIELIEAARSQNYHTHFVLVSAYAEFEYARAAMQLGCDDYILKPPMKDELKRVLLKIETNGTGGREETTESLRGQFPEAHPLVKSTLDIIESGYKCNLNQQHIAEQLNITPEYLSYLFARDVGQTFSKFIKSYRISRALLLLKEGGVTLKDVAYETGFIDRKYFNKVFHEVMDMTPSEYIDSLNR